MKTKFNSVLIIGMGLIGSSISRALTENHVANNVYG
jgi:Prephenate dehydrogenase